MVIFILNFNTYSILGFSLSDIILVQLLLHSYSFHLVVPEYNVSSFKRDAMSPA